MNTIQLRGNEYLDALVIRFITETIGVSSLSETELHRLVKAICFATASLKAIGQLFAYQEEQVNDVLEQYNYSIKSDGVLDTLKVPD